MYTDPKISNNKKGITLWQLMSLFVFVGIFFIPFTSYSGINFLGEFAKESSAIFFLLAGGVLIFQTILTDRIYIPFRNILFQILLLLFLWYFISTVLNFAEIKGYFFKGISGPERFIRQYAVVLLSGILFFLTYLNVFQRFNSQELFFKIRRIIFYSMIIVTSYAIIEILIIKFNQKFLYSILELYDFLPFVKVELDYNLSRISSITFETPALATYLFMVAGWMFSYVLTDKGLKAFIPGIITILLAVFSDSRAGLFVIFLQAAVFGILLIRQRKYHRILIKVIGLATIALLLMGIVKGRDIANYISEQVNSFEAKDDQHGISNRSRFGIQYASLMVFLENPIIGVGYGQQAYEAKNKYPAWATKNNWEFRLKYLNFQDSSFPPGYNIYTRLLAETGIVGIAIFLFLLIMILLITLGIIKKNDKRNLMAIVIFTSMIGFYFNWLKMDTIRVFGFWLNFALLLSLTEKSKPITLKHKQDD